MRAANYIETLGLFSESAEKQGGSDCQPYLPCQHLTFGSVVKCFMSSAAVCQNVSCVTRVQAVLAPHLWVGCHAVHVRGKGLLV